MSAYDEQILATLQQANSSLASVIESLGSVSATLPGKADAARLAAHEDDDTAHCTVAKRAEWDGKLDKAGVQALLDILIPVGTIIPSLRSVMPGWLMLDGSTVSSADYPELVAALQHLPGATPDSVTLPDFRGRTFWGADGVHRLGMEVEAALPNIRGQTQGFDSEGSVGSNSGALSTTQLSNSYSGGSMRPYRSILLDASAYNSIYSDDCDTVQPPAITVNIFIKA